jgi:hypothetical protein
MNQSMKTPASITNYTIGLALVVALLLLVPFIAMQVGDEVNWSPMDFIIAWVLLFGAGMTYKLIAGKAGNIFYRLAAGIAVGTALFLVWSNLAVGLIGSENNPANMMYLGVLAVLLAGGIIARFKPYGLAVTLFSAVLVQIIITIIAIIADLGAPENTPIQLIFINGFFIALWISSALLFWYAAKKSSE